jgi:hypothetical protein
MKILIQTCDRYKNLLEAHKYTYDKFFVDKEKFNVVVLGYSKPDFDLGDWQFISMGEDRGPQNFSNDIRQFFESFDDEFFIWANDDIVYVDEPNMKVLDEIVAAVKELPNFGRIGLASHKGGPSDSIVKEFDGWNISEIGQESEYRLSLQYSIWKTSYFKKYLTEDLNPWQWETRNTAKNDGHLSLRIVGNRFIKFGHIMKQCKIIKNWHCDIYGSICLDQNDVEIIEKMFEKHKIKEGAIFFDKQTRNVKEIKNIQ